MDIVAYSKLPMDQQQQLISELQESVRNTSQFIRAQAGDQLIRLPTGDGIALVFFGDPEAPVRCALELSRTLRDHPNLQLRMGIHSGPVYRLADINANRNVAGGGINIAQRVMDCCDAGHILVSEEVAKVLSQVGNWKSYLQDIGEAEVKHALRVHLFNLCTNEAGNPSLPTRLSVSVTSASEVLVQRWATQHQVALVLIGLGLTALVGFGLAQLGATQSRFRGSQQTENLECQLFRRMGPISHTSSVTAMGRVCGCDSNPPIANRGSSRHLTRSTPESSFRLKGIMCISQSYNRPPSWDSDHLQYTEFPCSAV